ncbi:cuticle protein 19.8-like [Ornithodoros turicata]|uniref:cuticle protein 19.8-like n=1 Tax=Ornithodoros turicata TaxID=34597 RepID=UPI0031389C2A
MKFVIVFATLAAFANGGTVPAVAVPVVEGEGTSTHYKSEDGLGNYQFGYDISHTSGGNFHKETGSAGYKAGSYGIRDADGRVRVVNYVADENGFRADVQTNEPGVEPKDPAHVTINKTPSVAPVPSVAFNLPVQPLVTVQKPASVVLVPPKTTVVEKTVAPGSVVAAPLVFQPNYPVVPGRVPAPAHFVSSPYDVYGQYALPQYPYYAPYGAGYPAGYPAYYNYAYPKAPVSNVVSYERVVAPQRVVPYPGQVQFVQHAPSLHLLNPWDRK